MSDFRTFNQQMGASLRMMLTGQQRAFLVDIPGDALYEAYLNAYPEADRQGHTCRSCAAFIRNFGGLVVVDNGQLRTYWDFEAQGEYTKIPATLKSLVLSSVIQEVAVFESNTLGKEKNRDAVRDVVWEHLHTTIPVAFLRVTSADSDDALRGTYRTDVQVFHRGLVELTPDSVETALEMIAQGSVYRGEEHKGALLAFQRHVVAAGELNEQERKNYAWKYAQTPGARIRGTALGTFLIDLSAGMELDKAEEKFGRVMDPTNYKRPKASFSRKQVEEAEATIDRLGYRASLGRRFANQRDLNANNVLFLDLKEHSSGIFDELKEEASLNLKSLSKVEEITLDKFLKDVLPTSKTVEILLQDKHRPNLVSLTTATDGEAPTMFNWNNPVGWSYEAGLADSALQREVTARGGKVDGVMGFRIIWNEKGGNENDLDAHAVEPNGNHISFMDMHSVRTGGRLDVDIRQPMRKVAVENITWPGLQKLQTGPYSLTVNNFSSSPSIGFRAEVQFLDQVFTFDYNKTMKGKETVLVATLNYLGDGRFQLASPLNNEQSMGSDVVLWGLPTNRFHRVTTVTHSPNYWNGAGQGNKHTFFLLAGAVNDGEVRGYLNEFLKPELYKNHKRVFEALAGRSVVAPVAEQLSGLGFSETKKSEFYVRVTGKFTRTLKVTL